MKDINKLIENVKSLLVGGIPDKEELAWNSAIEQCLSHIKDLESLPPQSEVSEVRIKPEEFLKDMGYSEIIKTPEGIIEPSFQWLTVINLLKEYDSRKWMQDKPSGKEERKEK